MSINKVIRWVEHSLLGEGTPKQKAAAKAEKKRQKKVSKAQKRDAKEKRQGNLTRIRLPELKRGDSGPEVKQLQSLLNKVGAMLEVDGIFGGGCERGVRYAQNLAGVTENGIADDKLCGWLQEQPEPFPPLDSDGIAFIALKETGGLSYYRQVGTWPHFPGEESGITLGVGYDLRWQDEKAFRALWSPYFPSKIIKELAEDLGRKGSRKRADELKAMGIQVPFSIAWNVFLQDSLPNYYRKTEAIYPALGSLPPLCQAVLVSLVYNRGDSLVELPSRQEMRNIRDLLQVAAESDESSRRAALEKVADELVSMKRLWPQAEGLRKRRDEEAVLWLQGLDQSHS